MRLGQSKLITFLEGGQKTLREKIYKKLLRIADAVYSVENGRKNNVY